MPPEQQLASESASRRESLVSRRGSLFSRRESLIGSLNEIIPEGGKILENGSSIDENQVENEAEAIPEPEPEPEPEPLSPEEEKRLREEEEQIRKKIAIEMRKAELRAKMEEASKARRAKKGFMTPERKKKLRLLLRKKAAEELRKEQERKANERRWMIEERCGEPEDLEWASKDDLIDICEDYFQRIIEIESDKWDLEYEIRKQTFEITELTQKVSDLRGKFQRPVLKKVSKYENKFAKLQRKAAEYNFRSQLKIVRRPDYKPKEEEKKSHDKVSEENENPEKEEEAIEKTEDVSEGGERISLKSLEEEEKSKLEEDVGIVEEGFEAEGRTESPRVLGGGDPAVERGEVPEGELEGGQSPDLGEVQPSELPESSEPLPPPQPQHTPDDLWDYLKETVSGEHPATVEEFVQKLIGTLEHVPEEYLKPVIDYNIKRATSPSVTDGEHLESKEGDQQLQGEALETESGETQDGAVLGDENPTAAGEEGAPSLTEEGYPVEDQATLSEDFPEDRPDSAAGYSALEAAS